MKKSKWELYENINNSTLNNKSNISDIIVHILANRGLTKEEEINKFLNPRLSDLHDPFLMKDMETAVNRILYAKNNKEHITIYGDYDVGATRFWLKIPDM